MDKQANLRTAQGITLLLASILTALLGSFAASALGAGLLWLVSLAGYLLGIFGAARLGRAGRPAMFAFFAGALVMALEQLRGNLPGVGAQTQLESILWYAATCTVMVWAFSAIYAAVRSLLENAGAPPSLALGGRTFAPWTAAALALTLAGMLLSANALLQMCIVMAAFALMVSALVVGIRFLLGARTFFLERSGRKL